MALLDEDAEEQMKAAGNALWSCTFKTQDEELGVYVSQVTIILPWVIETRCGLTEVN